jgi:dGTPase
MGLSSKKAPLSLAQRQVKESVPDGDDRTDFRRDRDIILYTSAFKRLSGITQVVSADTGHTFHNRLTHTLQVAQVGKSLAEKLLLRQPAEAAAAMLEPDAVEAGCLAHDLGHPPFGHIAEEKLNELVGEDSEGFEGNAQSFRIVSALAFRSPKYSGLNLTRGTLSAILKYPWTFKLRPPKKKKKWGAYETEIDAFKFATSTDGSKASAKSLGAELMDWSDDLTYAVHDVEDFYRAGLIPLHRLRPPAKILAPDKERDRFLGYVWSKRSEISELSGVSRSELDSIFGEVVFSAFSIDRPYDGTRDQRARLRRFTSSLVNRYINGLTLKRRKGDVIANISPEMMQEIAILKQLTWFYVIEAPGLAIQQHAQTQAIEYLFAVFANETRTTPSKLLPPYYRERLAEVIETEGQDGPGSRRLVADLIAGMTEAQEFALYQRLKGIVLGSAMDHILV